MIIDTQNLEGLRLEREVAAASGLAGRVRRRAWGLGTSAYERRVLRRADRVLVCSSVEEERLRGLGVDPVSVVPNGVDLVEIVPTPEPAGEPVVLFPGSLSYPPNEEAARWIAGEIAPLLRRARPDCRVIVAGRDAAPGLRSVLAAAGVEVHSPVPDMAPLYADATVVLVPLRSGGGTRVKILEAWAAGRPVVSTTLGIEGLACRPGQHALVADSAAGLARLVNALLADASLRSRLAVEGRRLVEERYGWDAIGQELLGILGRAR